MTTSPLLRLFAALMGLCAAACASAPLNFTAEPAAFAPDTPRAHFHDACAAVVNSVDGQGFTLVSNAGGDAFLARLLVGAGEEAPATPLQRYAEAKEIETSREPALAAALVDDAGQAARLIAAAAASAEAVLADGPADPDQLARDIAAAERALSASRRAGAFFAAVEAELSENDAVALALAGLAEETERLAGRADALADARWRALQGRVS